MVLRKELFYIVFSTAILGGLAIAAAAIIKSYSVSDQEDYTSHITRITLNNGKERLRFNVSGEYIGPLADHFFPVNGGDSLVTYRLGGKFGFVNIRSGEHIVSSKSHNFRYAWNFDHQSGWAAVLCDNQIGFIDGKGRYKIVPQYPYRNKTPDEEKFGFSNGFSVVPLGRSKYGLINQDNMLVLKGYDSIGEPEHGLRIIVKDDYYGLADSAGNIILNTVADDLSITPFGVAFMKDGNRSLYEFNCKTVISEHVYDTVEPLAGLEGSYQEDDDYGEDGDEEAASSLYSVVTVSSKEGLIENKTGKLVIPVLYDDISYISDSVLCVVLDEKSYLVDIRGKFIKYTSQDSSFSLTTQ